VERQHPSLSVVLQCRLLDISRSGVYYQSSEASLEDVDYMKLMDRQYLATPSTGPGGSPCG
jgi:putative transposase